MLYSYVGRLRFTYEKEKCCFYVFRMCLFYGYALVLWVVTR